MADDTVVGASLEGRIRALEVEVARNTELVVTGKLFEAIEAAA